jgi:hypothetical protein
MNGVKSKAKMFAKQAGKSKYYDGTPCRKGHIGYRYTRNSGCVKCKKVENKKKQTEHQRNWRLKNLYGLTKEQLNLMLVAQNNCCAICGKEFTLEKKHRFVIDHDHTTNKARGLLCNNCNGLLGFAFDRPETLSKAVAYITFHKPLDTPEQA